MALRLLLVWKTRKRLALSGGGPIGVADVDDGVAEQSPDLRTRPDPVRHEDSVTTFFDLTLYPSVLRAVSALVGVRGDEVEMALVGLGVDIEGLDVDPGVGQRPQDAPEDARARRGSMTVSSVSSLRCVTLVLLAEGHYTKIKGEATNMTSDKESRLPSWFERATHP